MHIPEDVTPEDAILKDTIEETVRTASLSIRPSLPYRASMQLGYTKSHTHDVQVLRSLRTELAEQKISASSSPVVLTQGLTAYLHHYQHACTEQLISQVFPWLNLVHTAAYADHREEVRDKFLTIQQELQSRQNPDGGLSLWPGLGVSEVYPSLYTAWLLIESQDRHFPVSKAMLNQMLPYLWSVSRLSTSSLKDIRRRALAIFLLARLGENTSNELIDLQQYLNDSNLSDELKNWKSDIAVIYIASALKLLQVSDKAEQMIEHYQWVDSSDFWLSEYDSPVSLNAQYFYLMSKYFPDQFQPMIEKAGIWLAENIHNQYNTHSVSFVSLAISQMDQQLADLEEEGSSIQFKAITYLDNSTTSEQKLGLMSNEPFPAVSWSENDVDAIKIIANGPLFYALDQAGFDINKDLNEEQHGIEIQKTFFNENLEEITQVEKGDTVIVKVKARSMNKKHRAQIAIVDLLPGGFEVDRQSVLRSQSNWGGQYTDVREDRIVFYLDLSDSVTELTYKVKATSSGVFHGAFSLC